MRDLLETRFEALSNQLDVVGKLLGRLVEARIGHHHRPGEIIEKRQAEQAPRALVEQRGRGDDRIDDSGRFHGADLERHLEKAGRRLKEIGEVEIAPMEVEAAHEAAHDAAREEPHLDAVARQEPLGQGRGKLPDGAAKSS